MVSIVYDSYEKLTKESHSDSGSRKLEVSRSQGSDIAFMGKNVISVRLKYFMVKVDLSCTLFLREPNYRRE